MKKDLSWIVAITDRSGSMSLIRDDAIGGFNAFIESQKQVEGEAEVTLVLFDNEYLVPYRNKPLNEVVPLDSETYVPRGSTALLDAIGRTINEVGADLSALPEDERPEHVIIVILTDGEENSSREFSNQQIKEMITHQTDVYNWQFIYIAANVDAFANAQLYGVDLNNTYAFESTREGTQVAYATMSTAVAKARGA